MKKTIKLVAILFIIAIAFLGLQNSVLAAEEVITLDGETTPVYTLDRAIAGSIVIESGNVTINATADGSVKTDRNYSAVFVKQGATLTINGGTYTANGANSYVDAAVYASGGNVIINDGTFYGANKNYAVRVCAGTMTVNGGTFGADSATQAACCESTMIINGGSWSSKGTYNGQADILAACYQAGDLRDAGTVIVTGGIFENFDPTKIYYSSQTSTATTINAVKEGYEYDSTTGTVACAHNDLEKHEEVPATYEAEGTKEYWVCTTCLKWFADENGTTEITDKDSVIIPKLVQEEEENTETPDVGVNEDTGDTDVKEETDESPKMGVDSTALTVFAIVAVISLAGIALIKKANKR